MIGAIIIYAYIVGADSSVIRATVMAVLTLFALLPGRQISLWRLMSYVWIGMLMRNPYFILYDL